MADKYYVYVHRDLETFEIVYIGHGSGGRAWQCGSTHSPLRCKEHCEWSDKALNQGRTPDEWVQIIMSNMSKEAAKTEEKKLIWMYKPKFNKSIRFPLLKFTPDLYDKAIKMREKGLSYEAIGLNLQLSTMVVHRGLTGKTISLETALADR